MAKTVVCECGVHAVARDHVSGRKFWACASGKCRLGTFPYAWVGYEDPVYRVCVSDDAHEHCKV